MRKPAKAWQALPQDDTAVMGAYLDRWIHEELGYGKERPKEVAAINQSRQTCQRRAKVKSPLTARLPKDGHDAVGARELVGNPPIFRAR